MKPYDGGAWRGVSPHPQPPPSCTRAYDASGEMLMHLQKAVDYDVFARSLSIGAETMVMKFQPDQPMHLRYAVDAQLPVPAGRRRGGDDRPAGQRVLPVGVQLVRDAGRGGEVYPIDYANACPDVALTSLHYYFPWAIKALVKWCVVRAGRPGRRPRLDLETDRYFAIADEPGCRYAEKLAAYRALADDYFETERYQDFCASQALPAWTRSCWTGWPVPTSTGCWSGRSGRCTRPTSTTSSSRTCAACSACGCATRARGWPRPDR